MRGAPRGLPPSIDDSEVYLDANVGKQKAAVYSRRHDSVRISVMTRRVLLYPGEDGFVVAEVPSLPGCISQGKTREEALDNVREAISLHEEVLRERGEPLPEDKVELVEVAA